MTNLNLSHKDKNTIFLKISKLMRSVGKTTDDVNRYYASAFCGDREHFDRVTKITLNSIIPLMEPSERPKKKKRTRRRPSLRPAVVPTHEKVLRRLLEANINLTKKQTGILETKRLKRELNSISERYYNEVQTFLEENSI